jgi:phosphate-selective porin OprO/OprP
MKTRYSLLTAAVLTALAGTANAEIAIDVIGGSEVSFEGLIQTDSYWYNDDFRVLSSDGKDGTDTDFGMRRAEIILKGKGPGCRPPGRVENPKPLMSPDGTVRPDAAGEVKRFP